jgi:hypothetical protein
VWQVVLGIAASNCAGHQRSYNSKGDPVCFLAYGAKAQIPEEHSSRGPARAQIRKNMSYRPS